jgi:transposase
MKAKGIYFRPTSAQQRKLLFETWEATGSVSEACGIAHVGRATFYYWKARFKEKGYAGLAVFESRVAHKLNRTDAALEGRVIELRRAHPDWGKLRIAHELAKEHNWVAVISPNTVRRILNEAGQWSRATEGPKKSNLSRVEPPSKADKR